MARGDGFGVACCPNKIIEMNFIPDSLTQRCGLLAIVAALAALCRPLNAVEPAASLDTNAPTPELLTWQKEYGPTHDQRMKWWRAARFGMFIHWGVYSVPAGVWNGTRVTSSGAERIMNRGRIPVADYQQFTAEFNPVKFNAEEWVKIAKNAGMKYIVITAKHHDGFAMFHSQADPFNIYDATPFKRDPLKELAEACRKEGIKLGFYYSQAQDWNNGGSAYGGKWDPAQEHDMDDYIDKIAVPQVKEILSNYGAFPAVLWWDTAVDMNPARAQKLYDVVKALKPNIIMNNRLLGSRFTNNVPDALRGDTQTPENVIPPQGYPGRDWETCMTMNGTWGYMRDDNNWKSPETLIHNLCDIADRKSTRLNS